MINMENLTDTFDKSFKKLSLTEQARRKNIRNSTVRKLFVHH